MKNEARTLISTLLFAAPLACFEDGPAVSLGFVTPEEGDTWYTDVDVKLALTGVTLDPQGTHLFLMIDEPCLTEGQTITTSASRLDLGLHSEIALMLPAGAHQLCAQLTDLNGVASAVRTTVSFTVMERVPSTVHIVEPQNGSALPRTFSVKLASTGIAIVPVQAPTEGEGHYFVRVDADCPAAGATLPSEDALHELIGGESELTLSLERGWHDLCAGLADGAGVVLPGSDRVRVITGY
jgi:hypothetical protein